MTKNKFAEMSADDIRSAINDELRDTLPKDEEGHVDVWVRDVFPDTKRATYEHDGKTWAVTYTFDGTDVTLSAPEEVTMEPVPVAANTDADTEMGDFGGQWIHIFDAGDYGAKGNWTVEKLQLVVENFRRLKAGVKVLFAEKVLRHEPAAVIGHSHSDKDPALGWVESLQLKGGQLWAKFRDVHPILESAVTEKRYPNRSVELYGDFHSMGPALRRVAFLGAVPPEVKTLAPMNFNDNGSPWVVINKEETVKNSTHAEHPTTPATAAGSDEKVEVSKGPIDKVMEAIKKVKEAILPAEEAVDELEAEAKPVGDDENKTPAAPAATPAAMSEGGKTVAARVTALELENATMKFMEAMPSNLAPAARARIEAVVPALLRAEGTVSFSEGRKDISQLALTTFAEIIGLASKNGLTVPTTPVATARTRKGSVIKFNEPKHGGDVDPESTKRAEFAEAIAPEIRKEHPDWTEAQVYAEGLNRAQVELATAGASAGQV